MTPAERAYWALLQRRAAELTPDLARALLRAYELLRERVSEAELARLIAEGPDAVNRALLAEAVLDRAFLPLRDQIRRAVTAGVRAEQRRMPARVRDATTEFTSSLSVAFDVLSPHVITAIRTLETRVMTKLSSDARETVRAFVENGLRDGVNPRTVARGLRSVLALAPNQERAIANFRAALETAHTSKDAMGYVLRDRRFDATLKAARASGEPIPAAKIDRMAEQYRKRMVAFNAETQARTATLDSLKLGQQLAWQDAIERGIVDGGRLEKTWLTVLDGRERPEHHAMNGETVPLEEAYSNGQMIPGESDYNCRCVSQIRMRPALKLVR